MSIQIIIQNAVIPIAPRLIIFDDSKYEWDTGMMQPVQIKDLIKELLSAARELQKLYQM